MKNKTVIWIGVYALIAYGGYYLFFSKSANVKKIIGSGASTGTPEQLMKFEAGFLREWARAVKKAEPSFIFGGKTFNTKGGRAVK